MRIRRQILRWVDKGSQDGYTDQSVISLIGMKGEDKASGYTWDYRDYGTRNPQAYNNPKLFEEYRRQEKPEYRNLTWLHSGTKDTKIRQEERKNEEFARNVTDILGHHEPEPEVKCSGSYSHPQPEKHQADRYQQRSLIGGCGEYPYPCKRQCCEWGQDSGYGIGNDGT